MNIYERTTTDTKELCCIGHVDIVKFKENVQEKFDKNVNLGDIKHAWEAMRVFRRNTSFIRCSKHEFGAEPITVVRIN